MKVWWEWAWFFRHRIREFLSGFPGLWGHLLGQQRIPGFAAAAMFIALFPRVSGQERKHECK